MLQGLPKSVDVAVIGAGMVGAATAFELQKRGKTVIVIDPNNAWGRASYGNSGVITRSILLPMSSPAVWGHLAAYAFNRTNGLRIRYQDATCRRGPFSTLNYQCQHGLWVWPRTRWSAPGDRDRAMPTRGCTQLSSNQTRGCRFQASHGKAG